MRIGLYTCSRSKGIKFRPLTIPSTLLLMLVFCLCVILFSFSLSWLSLMLDRHSSSECDSYWRYRQYLVSVPVLNAQNSRSSYAYSI